MDVKKLKAENLKRLRKERNLEQKDIADILNIYESSISGMETRKRAISDKTIDKLCKAWGIEPYEFVVSTSTPIIKDKKEMDMINILRRHDDAKSKGDRIQKKGWTWNEVKEKNAGKRD